VPAPRVEPTPAARVAPTPPAAPREIPAGLGGNTDSPTVAARVRDDDDLFRQTGWWGDAGPVPDGPAQVVPPARPQPSPSPRPVTNGNGAGNGVARPVAELRVVPSPRDEPVPAPAAAEPVVQPDRPDQDEAPGDGAPFTLRRRVPQAHLTPELRQPTATEAPAPAVPAASAASALSRYQASRQAARDVVDGDSNGSGRGAGW
jgi:hypothetical protein